MSHPEVSLSALPHANGSARYKWQDFEIISAVNGPIEVQRRDEIPDEAFIEVNVRPANGVGGTRERHIESLITSLLHSLILTHLHPRTLIQVTLQILSTPETGSSTAPIPQSASHLPVLPHLLHAALLALLNGNVPLGGTFTVAYVGVDEDGRSRAWPSVKEMEELDSMHVFAVSAKGKILLVESEGDFGVEDFERAGLMAQDMCLGAGGEDQEMDEDTLKPLQVWLREILGQSIKQANQWREHL